MVDLRDCKNVNDVVYKIARRAKELTGMSLDALRREVAPQEATTDHAVWKETRGKSRGVLIEEILTEEFTEEYPRDLMEEEY
jgi:hypothetical protein